MKILVQPSDGFNNFCAVTEDSSALMVVVPMEQILCPVSLMIRGWAWTIEVTIRNAASRYVFFVNSLGNWVITN